MKRWSMGMHWDFSADFVRMNDFMEGLCTTVKFLSECLELENARSQIKARLGSTACQYGSSLFFEGLFRDNARNFSKSRKISAAFASSRRF
jgi:hypothetical protein